MDIIGGGRIGLALERRAAARGLDCRVWTRDDDVQELADEAGPILVCTRNDDLDGVVARLPRNRRPDLVFTQNGMIRPWLDRHGLADNGRGLIFAAVARRGDDLSPGGKSPFIGRHSDAVVAFFTAIDVPAGVVSAASFAEVELEKLVWNSAFGLLCDALHATVGETLGDPRCDVLLRELITIGADALAIEPDASAMIGRLRAYSNSIPTYRGGVKEWPWRNGFFVDAAATMQRALPVHAALVALLPAIPS